MPTVDWLLLVQPCSISPSGARYRHSRAWLVEAEGNRLPVREHGHELSELHLRNRSIHHKAR